MASTSPRAPRPGWYADPRHAADPGHEAESSFRWWDGEAWTAWLSDSAYAPRPRGEVARVRPVPVPAEPRSIRWFLAAMAVALIGTVVAGLSVIGQGFAQPSRPFMQAQPAAGGPAAREYRDYQLGPDRTAIIYERLALTLPPDVRILPQVDKISTVLRRATQAYAPVSGEELVALVVVGDAEPDLVVPGDAAASADRILPALLARYRQNTGGVTAERVQTEPWAGVAGAVRVSGTLTLPQPIAGAAHDDFVMVVAPWVQGDQSGMGVWVTLVPETASPELKELLLVSDPVIRLV